MKITLDNISRRFGNNIIFDNISAVLIPSAGYYVKGPNGSGKSTLLKTISGFLSLSSGKIYFENDSGIIPASEWYKYVAVAAPYSEIIEEFSVKEMLDFHFSLKPLCQGYSKEDVLRESFLKMYLDTRISDCSSGTKQRLRLALAIYSACPVLLLDEPLTNLDDAGFQWYGKEMAKAVSNRIVIVCSNNNDEEYSFCKESLVDFSLI